jgi:hypothetical protein
LVECRPVRVHPDLEAQIRASIWWQADIYEEALGDLKGQDEEILGRRASLV